MEGLIVLSVLVIAILVMKMINRNRENKFYNKLLETKKEEESMSFESWLKESCK